MRKKTEFYFLSADGMFIFSFLFLCNSIPAILGNAAAVLLRFLSPEKAASHYWLNRDGSVGI